MLSKILLKIAYILFIASFNILALKGQQISTTILQNSVRICNDTSRINVKVKNNTLNPLLNGKVTIDLSTFALKNNLGRIGFGAAPNVMFVSGVLDTFILDAALAAGDSIEVSLSFETVPAQLNSAPVSIVSAFIHDGGTISTNDLITIVSPTMPQIQITTSGPTQMSACSTAVTFCDTIKNISLFDVSNIRTNLFFRPSSSINNVVITPNTITYNSGSGALSSFNLAPGGMVIVCYDKIVDCSAGSSTRDSVSIRHNNVCANGDIPFEFTTPNVTVTNAQLVFNTPPSGTVNVHRGDTLTYNVVVNNTGMGGTNQGRYCVSSGANVTLSSVEIGGIPLTPSASSPPGFMCFDLPALASSGMFTVTERWVLTNCTSPLVTPINRQLRFGCLTSPNCYASGISTNNVNVLVPMNSMAITTRTPLSLARCGATDTVFVKIRNTAGPHDTLKTVRSRLNLPTGFVQLGLIGGGVSYTGINDSIMVPNILPGDSVSFGILVRATCGIPPGSASFSFFARNANQPCVQNNSRQVNTSFIAIQSADLSITSSTPATLTPFVGGTYPITTTVANGGNGALDSVYYCVQNRPYATLSSITIGGQPIPLFSSSSMTNCYVINRALLDAYLGVGVPFVKNTIQVVENWTFTSCPSPALDLIRQATFGCSGNTTCIMSNLRPTGVNFGVAIPNVSVSIQSATRPACFVNTPSEVVARIRNTGSAPISQIVYTLTAGNNSISNIVLVDSLGNNLADQTVDVIISSGACSGSVRDTVRNIQIPAGSYFEVRYRLTHSCACSPGCATNNIYNSNFRINRFTDNCMLNTLSEAQANTADFDAYINGYVEGTQDLTSVGEVQYSVTSMELDWFNNDYPNAFVEQIITLPQGIDYVPGSIVWTDPNGLVFPVASTTYIDNGMGGPDQLRVRWNNSARPPGFIFSGGNGFTFDVQRDCSERTVTGCSQTFNLNISALTELTIDPACSNCPTRCIWSNPSLPMNLICPGPGPCTCEGMNFDSLQVQRINFGIPDNNNNRVPDGSSINLSLVERDRFIRGDSLNAYFQGRISNTSQVFTHGYAIVELNHTNFVPLGASVRIYDASTATTYTCNNVPLTPVGMEIRAEFTPAVLNGLGCAIPAGLQFDNNDSVKVNIQYKVNNPFTGIQQLVEVPTRFFVSNGPIGVGTAAQCNERRDRLAQIGIMSDMEMSSSNFGACDLPDFFVRQRLHLGSPGLDEFPYEIRQIGIPESITFTKPSAFNHRIDQFGVRLTQNINPGSTNIVNLPNGTVPPSFIDVMGDQLIFRARDYFNSLGDNRINPDEGFTIDYFPKIQGSCLSVPGNYSYTTSQILSVNSELFGRDTIQIPTVTKSFTYLGGAQLQAAASSGTVTVCSASEAVNIAVNNVTNFNAPNSFITIRSPSGGLVGFDVIDNSTNMVINPLPFGIYPLGNIGPNGSRSVRVNVRTNNCNRDSLEFVAGWDCAGYPTTLEQASCSDPSTIYFEAAGSGINLNILRPMTDTLTDLCTEVTYEVEIISTNLGFLRDIYFQGQLLSPYETYVPGSMQMAYPSRTNGGTYMNIADPVSIPGGFEMDVSSFNPYLDSVGLVGSKDLDSNKISLRFKTITSCNFISGSRSRFLTHAYNSCGDPLTPVQKTGPRINITSEPPSFNVDLALGDLTLNACNNQRGISVVNMTLNSGTPTAFDSIKYILPPGIRYVPGSYMIISNSVNTPPVISVVNGVQILAWPFTPGLSLGSDVSFSIQIQAEDIGQLCTDYEIVVQAFSTINDMCGTQTCNVGLLAGEGTQKVNIVKPKLKFLNLTGTLELLPAPANQVKATFNAQIINMGAALQAGSTVNIDIYDDRDGDGTLSAPDVFVVTASGVTSSTLLPNQTLNLMGMGTYTSGIPSICTVIGVLNPDSTCVCELETSFRVTPDIIVRMDTVPSVCSGENLSIGPNPTAGYAVEWISVNGSNLGFLSSSNTTPVTFNMDNNTGSNQIVQYAIRTSADDECYVFDTVSITVFPKIMDVANINACQNTSYNLPASPLSGTNFVWSPTTNLTFPGPDGRFATLNPVSLGLNVYTLSFTDANGCSASYVYNVNGIECGTANTSIGDYVWFDVNKNGIQDPVGDFPISGLTVNLYNANNSSLISTTTTNASGQYLFQFLPQGNYFVEFVPLNGFMFTNPNIGPLGMNSVANTSNGRSPNYFLTLGSDTLVADAGLVAMCNLDLNVTVGPCVSETPTTLKRVVTVDLAWQDNVYTYPFLNGSDTITVNVLGQTFKVPVATVSGTHSFSFDWQPVMNTVVNATASFTFAPSCNAVDAAGSFGPCSFDLALRKDIITPQPYKYGDTVMYRIYVINQGSVPAANVNIVDYTPPGLEFLPLVNPDWFLNPMNHVESFLPGPIMPGDSVSKDIRYRIIMNSGNAAAWINYSEITRAEDNQGNDRTDYDIDSTPGNGINGEDDVDSARIQVFDLALRKTIFTPPPYTYGQTVQFNISVYNQGNITAQTFSIGDSIPAGYFYVPVNNPAWALTGNVANRTINTPLAPGDSAVIPILLRIEQAASTAYVNRAEVTAATGPSGIPAFDFDGIFDNRFTNDPGGLPNTISDDYISGNGTGMGGLAIGDEDNHDVARIAVPDISLQKSVVSINPASSGNVANNDVTFSLTLQNSGNEILRMLTLSDNFIAQFGGSFIRIVTMPSIFSSSATTNPTLNPSFNGGVNHQIFDGMTGVLAPTQTIQVRLTLELMDVNPSDPLVNEAITSGKDQFNTVVRDTAQAAVNLPNCFLLVNCPTPNQGNFSCVSQIPAPATTVTAFNNQFGVNAIERFCSSPTITFSDVVTGTGCPGSPRVITRRYIIRDAGIAPIGPQADTCTVFYTVVDSIKPVFMTPPVGRQFNCSSRTLTADTLALVASHFNVMAVDNCSRTVQLRTRRIRIDSTCSGSKDILYEITATDSCGNSQIANATITIFDVDPPVINLPSAINTVSCSGSVTATRNAWLASVGVLDGCSRVPPVVSTSLQSTLDTCIAGVKQIRETHLFTAKDACGNMSMRSAVFTIIDNTLPVITAPGDLIVSCGANNATAIIAWLDNFIVTEACQTYTVTNDYNGNLPNLCRTDSVKVRWTVRDECGSINRDSAYIRSLPDVTPPVFVSCPANMTVNVDAGLCSRNVIYSTPRAEDCNGIDSVRQISGIPSGGVFPIGPTTVTFRAWDRCGNSSICSFVITVQDSITPRINCPQAIIEVCADNNSCAWLSNSSVSPSGMENCPGQTIVYTITGATTASGSGSASGVSFALGTSTVKYVITASNGQRDSCSFTVIVKDCQAPVITCPANLMVNCGTDNTTAINAWLASATATDNCGSAAQPMITRTLLATIDQCAASETRIYEFTARDTAGNIAVCRANVIVQDTTRPMITTGAISRTVQCDGKGNVDSLVAWLNNHGGAVATDACSGTRVQWSHNFAGLSDGCGFTGSATVIFTVSDECGNTNTTSATFTIEDTSVPTITAPANITVECGNDNTNGLVQTWLQSYTAGDLCSGVRVSNNFTALPTSSCTSPGNLLTVIWTATDSCGRTATAQATVTVVDSTKPVMMTAPQNLTLACRGSNNATLISAWVTNNAGAVFADACDASVTVTTVAGPVAPRCGGTTVTPYTITATDDCGNSLIRYAEVIIIDTVPPVLSSPTAIDSVLCSGDIAGVREVWINSTSGVDECGGTVSITPALLSINEVCEGTVTKTIERYVFTGRDGCGNTSMITDTFEIYDNVPPQIDAPQDLTVSCGAENGAAIAAWLSRYTVVEACQDYMVSHDYNGSIPNLCDADTIWVRWTVVDGCGSSATDSARIVSVDDNTAPVFINCPSNLFVNVDASICTANVIYSTPIAQDCNGVDSVRLVRGIASGQNFPLGVTEIMFMAWDKCGNIDSCKFTITVRDSISPRIQCPQAVLEVCADAQVCTWLATTVINPVGIENCPGQAITYRVSGATTANGVGSASGVSFNLGVNTVTYIITASNGQRDSCSFSVIVKDCQAPVFTNCPDTLRLECKDPTIATSITTWLASATASDNCSQNVMISDTLFIVQDQCGSSETRMYKFTAVDTAGNKTECYGVVIIEDTNAPIVQQQARDTTVECDGAGNLAQLLAWLNTNAGAVAIDSCGSVTWSHNYSEFDRSCGFTGSTTVTFTARDECGNINTTRATFTIADTTRPVIIAPSDLTVACGSVVNPSTINSWLNAYRVSDVCGEVTVTNDYPGLVTEECGGTRSARVIWTATDACGNNISRDTAFYSIVDLKRPEITLPAQDTIVECDGSGNTTLLDGWLSRNGNATAKDSCSNIERWENRLISGVPMCGGTSIATYEFVAIDSCGNRSLGTLARFIIVDKTNPTITTAPRDTAVQCDGLGNQAQLQTWLTTNGTVGQASDVCSGIEWSYALVGTQVTCGSNTRNTYEFRVTDACGNFVTARASFTILDTIKPQITVRASNLTVQCDAIQNSASLKGWLNTNGGAIASDVCNGVVWSNNFASLPKECGGTGSIRVIFTAIDQCGNRDTTSAIFTIIDTIRPVWVRQPSNLVIECDGIIDPYERVSAWLASAGGGHAQDQCSFVGYTNDFTALSDGCGFTGSALVTFTATDSCGNTQTSQATVTVVDLTAPIINTPARDTIVECDGGGNVVSLTSWLTNNGGAIASDVCSGVRNWEFRRIDSLDNCGLTKVVRFGFTAIDSCGNRSLETLARFTIQDTTKPTITIAPRDTTVQCDGAGNTGVLNTWIANNGGGAVATDVCSGILRWESVLVNTLTGCGITGSRTYRFTVFDSCGNSSSATATFTIIDTIRPVISVQAQPFTAQCNGSSNSASILAWLNNNGGARAVDGCSGNNITWTNNYGTILADCGATGGVNVTFYVRDECGNVDSTTARFTIRDTIAPSWELNPQNLNLECDGTTDPLARIAAWLNTAGGGEAEDSCSLVRYSHNYSGLTGGCSINTGSAVVTFTATDACGNFSTRQATVSVIDRSGPVINTPSRDTIVECDGGGNVVSLTSWLTNNGGAIASDVCSGVRNWEVRRIDSLDNCGLTKVVRFGFTAIDSCGNRSLETVARFTIQDTTKPTITIAPRDTTVQCDGAGNTGVLNTWIANNGGGAVATDVCSGILRWESVLVNTLTGCGITGSRTYRFTVFDSCGNSSSATATFTIIDTIRPVISVQAQPFTAQCNGSSNSASILAWLNNNGGARASDGCSGNNITWTNNYGTILADCGATGGVNVTFYVRDECGNVDSTTARFTIRDTIAPSWELNPQNLNLECDGTTDPLARIAAWLNTAGGGEAEDSCSLVRYSHNYTGLTGGCSINTGSALVTFTATDACGNFSTRQATVTIIDRVAPVITSPAKDTIVECDGAGNIAALNAWLAGHARAEALDQCSGIRTWSNARIERIERCGSTFTALYAFTATDSCGNVSAQTIARFTVQDTTRPAVVTAPRDSMVQCDGTGNLVQLNGWLAIQGGMMATDICSGPVRITHTLINETDLCALTGSKTYRFTAVDSCGNESSAQATFTIIDTIAPNITGGSDRSGECIASNASNDAALLTWLNSNAGASATDECGGVTWTNNFNDANFVDGCNNSRSIDVTFYATDVCGNVDSVIFTFSTGDLTPPVFLNCPRPPVVVDAPQGWCSSFVNFSLPIATDNCGIPIVRQIDTTGLTSGSLFPVGLTILRFEARDSCGNADTCEVKIVVNDFHTPPTIVCRTDTMRTNDLGMCGAVVNGLAPKSFTDNCLDNITICYEIFDFEGIRIANGLSDASGFKFPSGRNRVKYTIKDQVSLLITEVVQNGTFTGVEISNLGGATMDISCLRILRKGSSIDTGFTVPNGVLIQPGGVYTQTFPNIPIGEMATYSIEFLDRVIDAIKINAAPLIGGNIIRIHSVDSDSLSDWTVTTDCDMGSYGVFNPQLEHMPANGKKTALQSRAPSVDSCSFFVTVRDVEAPMCATNDTMRYELTNRALTSNTCSEYTVNVASNFTVKGVRITELRAKVANVGLTSAYLESPQGTKVQLWNNKCLGQNDIWIALDDNSLNALSGVSCNPMGNGLDYKPQEAFKKLTGENSLGNWKLKILNTGSSTSDSLLTFRMELLSSRNYAQADTMINNDPQRCDAQFTWTHPVFMDNCCEGSIKVEYVFKNVVTNDSSAPSEYVLSPTIDLDGTVVTRIFKVGTTIVRYYLTDASGNESTCEFRVIVKDTEKPEFTAGCIDRVVQLRPKECYYSLQPLPTASDNCGLDTIKYFVGTTPLDITRLPIGMTNVVAVAVDIYGNEDTCRFKVTVNEFIPVSTQMNCIGKVNISLDVNCEHTLTAGDLLIGDSLRCLENYCIEVKDANGNVRGPRFTQADIGKTFYVSVIDCKGSGNKCWSEVLIEDKLIAKIECPRDTNIWCNIDPLARFTSGVNAGKLRTGEAKLLNCEPGATISFIDDLVLNEECGIPRARINRKWTMKDTRGNLVSCTQVINILRFENQAITWPTDVTGGRALNCGAVASDASVILPDATGKPLIEGQVAFGDNYCDINIGYTDRRLNDVNCTNAYIIFRTWEVFNRCAPYQEGVNPRRHTQTIRVEDKTPPVIPAIADVTVSVNAWDCEGTYKLPELNITDNCGSSSLRWRMPYGYVDNGFVRGLRKGKTLVTVIAIDNCKNQSTQSFTVTVEDKVAPVASAKEFITVSLTNSGIDQTATGTSGTAKLFASQVDNGSYDNCTKVYMEVRREGGSPACLNEGKIMSNGQKYNNNLTYNDVINGLDQTVPRHLNDSEFDTDKGQYVKFCCADLDSVDASGVKFGLHKVWLRVWDDANGSGIYGDVVDGISDNYNETWTQVRVEDKVVPVIKCPAPIVIDCSRDTGVVPVYNFVTSDTLGINWNLGTWVTATSANTPARFLPEATGACGNYTYEFKDAGVLSTCNTGKFIRRYRIKGNSVLNSVLCNVSITVTNINTNPVLEWPIDLHEWNKCTLTEEDVLENTVRARVSTPGRADQYAECGLTGTDEWMCFGLTGQALEDCRAANATNGFTPTSGPLGSTLQNRVRFNSNYKNAGCNVFGKKITIEPYAVGDGCKKWLVKFEYINWCTNESAGCRQTIYKYEDTKAPAITRAPGADMDIKDQSCQIDVELRPTAVDSTICSEQSLSWVATIYPGVERPGLNETPVLPQGESYGLTATGTGNTPVLVFKGLKAGIYGLRYKVTDGCGNVSERDTVIGIWPKAPTPYCVSLSSAVMKNGLVELWAKDFDRGSFTNCGSGVMLFTFNRGGKAEHPSLQAHPETDATKPAFGSNALTWRHFFRGNGEFLAWDNSVQDAKSIAEGRPQSTNSDYNNAISLYLKGEAQLWIPEVEVTARPTLPNGSTRPNVRVLKGGTSGMQFGCKAGSDISQALNVETRVWDYRSFRAGSTQGSDFCKTRLVLIDNQGGCGTGTLVSLSGKIATYDRDQAMKEIEVKLSAQLPEYPVVHKTDAEGKFVFESLPVGVDYTIQPGSKDDYLNGVNTLDIVQIQRHILGIKKLDNPFKLIAADVDGDQAVRVNDIVEIRKIVLGISEKFTNSQSWKFVDGKDIKDQTPWPFKEVINHAVLLESKTNNDFSGVKMGDVDGTASANAVSKITEPRSTSVRMTIEDRAVKAGEEVVVTLKADQFTEVYGMQWSMEHEGMELISVDGRAIEMTAEHIGKVRKDLTTMSWASARAMSVAEGSEVMKLTFRASKAGRLAQMLQLTSEVTNAEAYTGVDMDRGSVSLDIRSRDELQFVLNQNEPNPWKTSTMIRYDLPQAGQVKVTISDVTGRVITTIDTKGEAGENTLTVHREQLKGATGVLIYKVESGSYSAQIKMLVIE